MRIALPRNALPIVRSAVLAAVLALGAAGAAAAADYVLVSSTDPELKPGLELDSGQHLALAAGKTATLMAAAGDITTLHGAASGAVVPSRKGGDPARLAALKVLVAPPTGGRTFGGRRGGVCPDAANLANLDDILQAQEAGCVTEARRAFDDLVARQSR
ncbi:MAG: hypothetical protein JF588_20650 [Caulobacterales bacterium]|nr:hypothetical protein [Caulobacterales bacterium]